MGLCVPPSPDLSRGGDDYVLDAVTFEQIIEEAAFFLFLQRFLHAVGHLVDRVPLARLRVLGELPT